MDILSLVIYALPLGVIVAVYVWRQRRIHARHLRAMQDSVAAGMIEPASLHPLIDESKCLGCGSCITACPETSHHDVLGLINGKAALIGPSECIGHGACKTACPFDAITLVFGTERRGLDIPVLKPNFESNVPGIYIAGELGGMGLIKNALTQGRQAMEAIAKAGVKRRGALDVLIVGAGPAGLAASLAAKQLGLNYLTVEQEALGGAVFQYPRGKLVMTAPVELPIVGKVHFRNTTKEELLQFWSQACNGLKISYRECVEGLAEVGEAGAFGDGDAQDRQRAFPQQKAQQALADRQQGGAQVRRRVRKQRFLHRAVVPLVGDDTGEQNVLGREVGVQRGLGDAGLPGHRFHADRAVAMRKEQALGGLHDLPAFGRGPGGRGFGERCIHPPSLDRAPAPVNGGLN